MVTRRRRPGDIEIIDAADIPYAPDAEPRAPRPARPDTRGLISGLLRLAVAVVLLYLAYVVLRWQQHVGLLPDVLKGLLPPL